jgi:hypothetical protein
MAKSTLNETERMVVTRVFDAPRELVWKAWTDPKYVMQWWGPKGFTAPYSYSGIEIFRRRFPQQSPRRAAVKISVEELRMKFSVGCLQWQPAGVPLLRVTAPNTRCFRTESRAVGRALLPKRILR